MKALLVFSLVVAVGMLLGWFGYRAILRIQAWGLALNEDDPIFNNLTTPEERMEFLKGYGQFAGEPRPAAILGSHGLKAAALK